MGSIKPLKPRSQLVEIVCLDMVCCNGWEVLSAAKTKTPATLTANGRLIEWNTTYVTIIAAIDSRNKDAPDGLGRITIPTGAILSAKEV